MNYSEFKSLLRTSALYLCRADRLEKFEGTYSRHQLIEMDTWLKSRGYPRVSKTERESRCRDKKRTYISCWTVGECDFDLMWKAYIRRPPWWKAWTTKPRGIAISSAVRRLQQIINSAIECWPVDISLVKYFDHARGEFINYSGTPGVFFHKDIHFMRDKEIRIIHWPNFISPTPDSLDFSREGF